MDNGLDMIFHDESEIEAVFLAIGEQIEAENEKTAVLHITRFEQLKFAYAVLEFLTKDMPDTSLSYEIHAPYKSMGYISLEGESLIFSKSKWLSRVVEFSDNVEIYPLTNEKIRMTFTFHGLTTPIE